MTMTFAECGARVHDRLVTRYAPAWLDRACVSLLGVLPDWLLTVGAVCYVSALVPIGVVMERKQLTMTQYVAVCIFLVLVTIAIVAVLGDYAAQRPHDLFPE